jgi:UDP-galactopyranose mutase
MTTSAWMSGPPDVVVLGAGVSGLSFAFRAAKAGRKVLVIEREAGRVGGCLHSHRLPDGFWFELGAHGAFASYGGFVEMASATGALAGLQERGRARSRFGLGGDGGWRWLGPAGVVRRLRWLDAAAHLPRGLSVGRAGKSVEGYYSSLLGPRNFRELVSPFLAAVSSQSADGFPVEGPGSLFKRRPRSAGVPRTFGFRGGLQTLCEAVTAMPGVRVVGGVEARSLGRSGGGFTIALSDGRSIEAPLCAVATPAPVAAALVERDWPEVAGALRRIGSSAIETLGVVLPRARPVPPEVAFLVATDGPFRSAVSRDVFPDARWRAFAFHFEAGRATRDEKLRSAAAALGVKPFDFACVVEARRTLPSPRLGHDEILRELTATLGGQRLALTGNYFDGLAIEDCVQRSFGEWARVAGVSPQARP